MPPPRHRSSPPPPPPSRPRHEHARGPRRHGARRDAALDDGPIDAALAAVVPDPRERAFVLRCILDEGPRHHRVASWALLRLLASVLEEVGGAASSESESGREPLGMRLPPSVMSATEDAEFPMGVPTAMIREVMDARQADAAVECLSDGPPHHALANAAMAWMIQAIYERVRRRSPRERGDRGEGAA